MSFIIKHPKTGTEFLVDTTHINDNTHHGVKRVNPLARRYFIAHHTAGNTAGDLATLRGAREVSVKYLVADPQDGNYRDAQGRLRIWQLLQNEIIGWSVGQTSGTYGYVNNTNSDSVELSNRGDGIDVFEGEQVEAFEALTAYEEKRLGQELVVFAHKDIAPGRKNDTHASFPLQRVKDFAKRIIKGILSNAPVEEKPVSEIPYFYKFIIAPTVEQAAVCVEWCKGLGIMATQSGVCVIAHGNDAKSKMVEEYATSNGFDDPYGRVFATQAGYAMMVARKPYLPQLSTCTGACESAIASIKAIVAKF